MKEMLRTFYQELKDGEPMPWIIVALVVFLIAVVSLMLYLLPEDASDDYLVSLLPIALVVGWLIAGSRR